MSEQKESDSTWTWKRVAFILLFLFIVTIIGLLITWVVVSEENFDRTIRAGDTYAVGDRTYTLPSVPILNAQFQEVGKVKILSDTFLQRQRNLLIATDRLLRRLRIPYFISGGTLIGFTMPGLESMMPHDDDLDIHVDFKHRDYLWSSDFAKECDKEDLEAVYLRMASTKLAAREGAAVRIRFRGDRMPVLDIFFETQDPKDGLWKKIDAWGPDGLTYNSREQWSTEAVFPLQRKDVDGMSLSFPNQPKVLLAKQYSPKVHERIVVPDRMLSHAFPYLVLGEIVWRKGA